eukprot:GHVU01209213.1.p1 GENE.GHVU01209213.1~~GHVU01209213.1.p1  ORF type:complete len:162 (+),score=18.42 GHVU01209213.1:333-818(+)
MPEELRAKQRDMLLCQLEGIEWEALLLVHVVVVLFHFVSLHLSDMHQQQQLRQRPVGRDSNRRRASLPIDRVSTSLRAATAMSSGSGSHTRGVARTVSANHRPTARAGAYLTTRLLDRRGDRNDASHLPADDQNGGSTRGEPCLREGSPHTLYIKGTMGHN